MFSGLGLSGVHQFGQPFALASQLVDRLADLAHGCRQRPSLRAARVPHAVEITAAIEAVQPEFQGEAKGETDEVFS